METYSDNWNACLLFRNKQLTKQLKNYQEASVLADIRIRMERRFIPQM